MIDTAHTPIDKWGLARVVGALGADDKPPAGYGHWTLQLLADELVALEIVDAISHETVRKVLKKTA